MIRGPVSVQRAAVVAALAVLGVAIATSTPRPGHASTPGSSDPIVLALHEWTGQHIVTHVAGHILERMGYRVRYVTAGAYPAAIALADGTLTAALELWSNNLGDFYPKLLAEGRIERLGELGIEGREGWLYPAHVEDACPGLPHWDALSACAVLFATPETAPAGRFLDYPAEWGARGGELIRGEKLPFAGVPAGSEGALVAELASSVARRSPLLMMFWAPHWALSEHPHRWVEIPPRLVEKYGLQRPQIFKAAWPGAREKWPAAYRFLRAYRMNNRTQESMMKLVDGEGRDVVEVTRRWVDENEPIWRRWVEAAMPAGKDH